MAFLFMDGMSHYATSELAQKWTSVGGNTAINATAGRRGGGALRLTQDGTSSYKRVVPTTATGIYGFAFRSNGAFQYDLFISDPTVTHLNLRLNADGSIQVMRGAGGTVLGAATAAGVFNYLLGYQYLELKWTIHPSAGIFQLRLNGSTTPVLNLSAQNTQNGGTVGWTTVSTFQSNFTAPVVGDHCDLYLLDSAGSVNNDFLGDQRVDTQFCTANGTTSNSTPSTGTNRALTIDEAPANGDTDYNTVTAVGDKDTLVLADQINAGLPLAAVQVAIFAKKTDAGAASIAPVLRHAGTDYDGTSVGLSTSYTYPVIAPYNLNPAGGAWTEAAFNALEVGYKRTA